MIRTNVAAAQASSEDAVRYYKELSKVERAFRSLKSVDLKVRPIHHPLQNRVRAHIFLCMLAYSVADPAALRSSVVAPAQRSPQARGRSRSQLPHSVRRPAYHRAEHGHHGLDQLRDDYDPTLLQQQALDLLKVSSLA